MGREELWKAVLAEVEISISRASFVTWFRETSIIDVSGGLVVISVPNGFAKNWLQDKYHKVIIRALRNASDEVREVQYIVGQAERAPSAARQKPRPPARQPYADLTPDRLELKDVAVDPESGLNSRYAFEHFIVGSFNELAHAAAQAVTGNPGTTYNPLFIYGGVGLGKTHLIQAIGNTVVRTVPGAKVRYVPAEKYMGEVVDALTEKTMGQLKEHYRSVDLLIMDDIQFIARTEKMQEEFFHVFNALYERNRQIVISSDKPPAAIPTLEQRLRSRFEGGMIADIGLPDFETRLAILKEKLKMRNTTIPEEVLRYVAEVVTNNIRDLEGVLNRLILRTTMSSAPLDVDETKRILAQVTGSLRRVASYRKVLRTVAEFYDIQEKDLVNRSRRKEIVKPRQVVMYLMRDELKCSFPFIGEKLGKKDHTTAIHAFRKITNDLTSDPVLDLEIKTLRERIYSNPV